jgi:hypothetical protein
MSHRGYQHRNINQFAPTFFGVSFRAMNNYPGVVKVLKPISIWGMNDIVCIIIDKNK